MFGRKPGGLRSTRPLLDAVNVRFGRCYGQRYARPSRARIKLLT
jgi:hypothetical protein